MKKILLIVGILCMISATIVSTKEAQAFRIGIEKQNEIESKLEESTITFNIKGETKEATLKEIGVSYEKEQWDRLMKLLNYPVYDYISGIFYIPLKRDLLITPNYKLDPTIARDYLKSILKEYDITAKNASMKVENGVITCEKEVYGQSVNLYKILENVTNKVSAWKTGTLEIDIPVITIEPKIKMEDLIEVKDILGEFTTIFNPTSKRANNIINGAKLIDGIILMPGEIFSAHESLSPLTTENGYTKASVFSDGDIMESIGGGICQLTSTFYNTVLFAELEVKERYPHRFLVSYVEAARDAAITSKYKDFKFRNNTAYPIYIYSKVKNGKIVIRIYGKEERASNRNIEFKVNKIKYITPNGITEGVKENRDARYGLEAELIKITYEQDIEVAREIMNYSVYEPLSGAIR